MILNTSCFYLKGSISMILIVLPHEHYFHISRMKTGNIYLILEKNKPQSHQTNNKNKAIDETYLQIELTGRSVIT